MNNKSGIAALTLLFAVLVVPRAGAEETAKSADKAPANQAAADLETVIIQKPRIQKGKPAVRCQAHTGSIMPRRGSDCTSNAQSQPKRVIAEQLRLQQLEMQRIQQQLLVPD